jgi:hypothetical protein
LVAETGKYSEVKFEWQCSCLAFKKKKKPVNDTMKINSDGAFSKESNSGARGFIIRDKDGDAMCSGRGKIERVLDPFHAELRAAVEGVRAALQLGMGHILLETDAVIVKQAVQSSDFELSTAACLITELKDLVIVDFLSWDHVIRPLML